MSKITRRNHPVRQLMDRLAGGGEPTKGDIADLQLAHGVDRAAVERSVRAAAKQIAAARETGHNARAREIARDTAERLIDVVGDPGPDEDTDPTDPRELANLIPRG